MTALTDVGNGQAADDNANPALAQYALASAVLPGGVCASARRNDAIGHPFFVSRGDGAWLFDLQGRAFLDMSTSHGASLLGHNLTRIKAAVQQALDMGIVCSAETGPASKNPDTERQFLRACYQRGVYFQPAVHTEADLLLALKVIAAALSEVRASQRGA